MVWVHDREVGVVKMEIGPLDPEKGAQGTRQRGKYSEKMFKGAVWVEIIEITTTSWLFHFLSRYYLVCNS